MTSTTATRSMLPFSKPNPPNKQKLSSNNNSNNNNNHNNNGNNDKQKHIPHHNPNLKPKYNIDPFHEHLCQMLGLKPTKKPVIRVGNQKIDLDTVHTKPSPFRFQINNHNYSNNHNSNSNNGNNNYRNQFKNVNNLHNDRNYDQDNKQSKQQIKDQFVYDKNGDIKTLKMKDTTLVEESQMEDDIQSLTPTQHQYVYPQDKLLFQPQSGNAFNYYGHNIDQTNRNNNVNFNNNHVNNNNNNQNNQNNNNNNNISESNGDSSSQTIFSISDFLIDNQNTTTTTTTTTNNNNNNNNNNITIVPDSPASYDFNSPFTCGGYSSMKPSGVDSTANNNNNNNLRGSSSTNSSPAASAIYGLYRPQQQQLSKHLNHNINNNRHQGNNEYGDTTHSTVTILETQESQLPNNSSFTLNSRTNSQDIGNEYNSEKESEDNIINNQNDNQTNNNNSQILSTNQQGNADSQNYLPRYPLDGCTPPPSCG